MNEVVDVGKIFIDMGIGSLPLYYSFFMPCLEPLGVVLCLLTHQQTIKSKLLYYILFMNIVEKKIIKSQELSINRQIRILETSRSHHYPTFSDQPTQEKPEQAIYQILLSVLRKQTRKPFQLIKQYFLFSDDESSGEVNFRPAGFQLEIVEENILKVCTRVRQRLLVNGFITIKNIYLKRLRIQEAYYNQENLFILHNSITVFQKFYLKWQGFGKLYQNLRVYRLLKLNLSRIDAISNDYTSRQLQDFHPFLSDRIREVEVINSYLTQSQNEQSNSNEIVRKNRRRRQRSHIQQIQEEYIDQVNNRSLKKSSTAYPNLKKVQDQQEIDSKVLITHKKEISREEAGSTAKPIKQSQQITVDSQEIYLIRDYKAKDKMPSNYIKVPVLSQNIKILEIQTKKKKTHKKRVIREQVQIQNQICENCKYCIQMRERRQMMQQTTTKFENIIVHKSESTSIEFISK